MFIRCIYPLYFRFSNLITFQLILHLQPALGSITGLFSTQIPIRWRRNPWLIHALLVPYHWATPQTPARFFLCFETRSHLVDQAGLELEVIFLLVSWVLVLKAHTIIPCFSLVFEKSFLFYCDHWLIIYYLCVSYFFLCLTICDVYVGQRLASIFIN